VNRISKLSTKIKYAVEASDSLLQPDYMCEAMDKKELQQTVMSQQNIIDSQKEDLYNLKMDNIVIVYLD
jgi:hypothetical protein